MIVAVLGADGYIGWALSLHLISKGHRVIGIDNLSRRRRVREVGSQSATPIPSPFERFTTLQEKDGWTSGIPLKIHRMEQSWRYDRWARSKELHQNQSSSWTNSTGELGFSNIQQQQLQTTSRHLEWETLQLWQISWWFPDSWFLWQSESLVKIRDGCECSHSESLYSRWFASETKKH